MEKSNIEKSGKINEMQSRLSKVKESVIRKKEQIEDYRKKRASLILNGDDSQQNKQKLIQIDYQIRERQRDIENAPAEIELLEQQIAAEKQRIAQQEKDNLIEQQQQVAEEVEILSVKFIEILEKANNLNEQLRAALLAETEIRQKTGRQIITKWCHGSEGNLNALLEKSKREIAGEHTALIGPGIIPGNALFRS
jgi:chromosome segregation ATPase